MGVRFVGDGVGESSVAFTTINLPNSITQTSGHIIIDQAQHLTSDSGVRSSYKPGQRQIRFNYRWNLLSSANLELIQEFLETIDGGNNWFTLQDNYIFKKDAISHQTAGSNFELINSTDLADASWPMKPIGKWAFITSGAQNNTRRRIYEYVAGGPLIRVSPVFAGTIAINDTFIIGVPVMIVPGEWQILPRNNNLFDLSISFVEKGD